MSQHPWLQLHLSTALALMFTAAILLALNVFWVRSVTVDAHVEVVPPYRYQRPEAGWPVTYMIYEHIHTDWGSGPKAFRPEPREVGYPRELLLKGLAIDAGVGFALLLMVAIISEALIRRKASKAAAP
jgi:hypothetical protein